MVDFVDILDNFRVTLDVFLSFYVCAIEFWRQENWITGKVGCEKKSRKTQIRQMSNIIACQKLMIYSIPRICSNI